MIEFFKYLMVSVVALCVDYSTYWAIASRNILDLPLAAVLGYTSGLVIAYVLMTRNVFKDGWLQDKKHIEFLMFLISGGLGMLLTYGVVWLVVENIGDSPLIAKTLAVAVSFAGVYLFRKLVIFRNINSKH